MEFQTQLKQRRIQEKMTQQELADRVFVSRSTVAKWESGISLPGKDAVSHLSNLFNENVEDWFEKMNRFLLPKIARLFDIVI